jgi:crotonobetainyl-CoA:carnitine CoA-transferase CaiB-like acyl-CoA transferase
LQSQIAMMDFQAAKYLVEGVVPPQAGNDHPYSTPMGVVRTADGFINIAVGGQGQWKAFCAAIACPELQDDSLYATLDLRFKNRPSLNAKLAEVFATRRSADWLQALEKAGVPAGPIYKMDEVFADPQVKHLGIAVQVPSERGEVVTLVGQPIGLSRTPAEFKRLLPDAGADNEAILGELGFDTAAIDGLRKEHVI